MKLNSSNSNPDINSFLTINLPVHLQFDWDQQWGDLIVIRLDNSPDKGDTYEKFKISICPNYGVILGMPKEELTEWDTSDDKWFGNEALLSEQNTELYSSPAYIYVYKDINGLHELFSYSWKGEFKNLVDGNLPKNLTTDKLSVLLNGKLFSGLYSHLKTL
ncbi:hypothetical protein OAZ21_01235 [Bacteroidota bacterium]|nr:hypothetical protein [Bacteroidota bacterium]